MTDRPLRYIIEPETPLKQNVVEFIFFIMGIKGAKYNRISDQNIDIYYGNNCPNPEEVLMIIAENSHDVICENLLEGKLKPEHIDKVVEFDFINAISQLMTDKVNSKLPDTAYD
jgi:hypothetical protein